MSYMRGPCYVWRDDNRVHVWDEDGYDGWDNTSWAEGRKHSQVPDSAPHGAASGVGIRQEVADAYVVMRLAELVCEQRIGAVVESAIANFGGNGGCLALRKLAATLVGTLEPMGSDPAAAEIREMLISDWQGAGLPKASLIKPVLADNLSVLPVERVLATVGAPVDEAIAPAHAQVALAAHHREHPRSPPTFQMLGFRERVKHKLSGRIDDPAGRETGLIAPNAPQEEAPVAKARGPNVIWAIN